MCVRANEASLPAAHKPALVCVSERARPEGRAEAEAAMLTRPDQKRC